MRQVLRVTVTRQIVNLPRGHLSSWSGPGPSPGPGHIRLVFGELGIQRGFPRRMRQVMRATSQSMRVQLTIQHPRARAHTLHVPPCAAGPQVRRGRCRWAMGQRLVQPRRALPLLRESSRADRGERRDRHWHHGGGVDDDLGVGVGLGRIQVVLSL